MMLYKSVNALFILRSISSFVSIKAKRDGVDRGLNYMYGEETEDYEDDMGEMGDYFDEDYEDDMGEMGDYFDEDYEDVMCEMGDYLDED
jgi:hypothetical protein